jgi:hypothetical protein
MILFDRALPLGAFVVTWDPISTLAGLVAIPISIAAAWISRRSVVEMQEQRMSASKPRLMARRVKELDEYQDAGNFELEVENIGTGPAFDVIGHIRHKHLKYGDAEEVEIDSGSKMYPIFYMDRPRGAKTYPAPVSDASKIDSNGKLRITYRDVYDRERLLTQTVAPANFVRSCGQSIITNLGPDQIWQAASGRFGGH